MGGNPDTLDISSITLRAWLSVGLGSGDDYLSAGDVSAWKGGLVDAGSGWDEFSDEGENTRSIKLISFEDRY